MSSSPAAGSMSSSPAAGSMSSSPAAGSMSSSPAARGAPAPAARGRQSVPVKTILVSVGLVLATAAAIEVVIKLRQVLIWVAIAAFFAIVLHPAVDFLVRKAHLRRTLATLIVFVLLTAVLVGAGYAFARPVANQVNAFVNNFSSYVADAKAGRGNVGRLVKRFQIDSYIDRNQANLNTALKTAEKPAVRLVRGVLGTLTAMATIVVVTFLMLIEGPRMLGSGLAVLTDQRRARAEKVMGDASRALAGYVVGNLATGIIAGGVCYVSLRLLGVPFSSVLALWVGLTTVIPLVGAVIGAVPAVAVAFIHSTSAGIAMIVILVVYQQIENRALTERIMRTTVALSPLGAVVSVLAGYQLLGLLGLVLAIPAAGVINVIISDLWEYRRARRRGVIAPSSQKAPQEGVT